jgi:hypothetical protein
MNPTKIKSLLIACTMIATSSALLAQTPPAPPADQGTSAVQPAEPQPQNPPQQENDAKPESAQPPAQSSQPAKPADEPMATPPVAAPQATPPTEEPKPAPKVESASGTVQSFTSSALVIKTASGTELSFVLDEGVSVPALHLKDQVAVEYVTKDDGTRHANRVTLATPKKTAVAPVKPKPVTPPPAEKPSTAPQVQVPPPVPHADVTLNQATAPKDASAAPTTGQDATATSASSSSTAEPHTLDRNLPAARATHEAASPLRMIVPIVILAGGLAFIMVLGVRQARHPA